MVTPVLIGLHVTWESFGTNRKEGSGQVRASYI